MDFLCRLLTADLSCLPTSNRKNQRKACENPCEEKENPLLVVRRSYTIRNEYPGPLTTYDGEERCEPRLIRLSDLKSSQVDMIMGMCEDQDEGELKCENQDEEDLKCEDQDEEELKCEKQDEEECEPDEGECTGETSTGTTKGTPEETDEDPCNSDTEECLKEFESQIFINFLPEQKSSLSLSCICSDNLPTQEQLIRIELRARTLYEVSACQDPDAASWDCLSCTEKLRFHWQAHAGMKLRELPFDNFRQCYLKNRPKNCPKLGIRQVRSAMRLRWSNMDRSDRMPFIVQSLLYQVSVGAINPRDHCVVREFFQKVK